MADDTIAPVAEEQFPSVRYGPDGQSMVCQTKDDAPSGWKDHPSKVSGAPDPSLETSEPRLSRVELMQTLKDRSVEFKPQLGGAELAKLVAASDEKEAAKEKMAKVREARKAKPKAAKAAAPKKS